MLQALLQSCPAARTNEICNDETFARACATVAYAHGLKCWWFNPDGKSMLTDVA